MNARRRRIESAREVAFGTRRIRPSVSRSMGRLACTAVHANIKVKMGNTWKHCRRPCVVAETRKRSHVGLDRRNALQYIPQRCCFKLLRRCFIRRDRSTTHAIISLLHSWMSSLDNGGSVRTISVSYTHLRAHRPY